MPRLSLIVITKNEEANIRRCLASVPFADEIVVVDSASTDRTVEVARSLGAKVLQPEDWPGFGPQKQRALDHASGKWILSLDADEWIGPELAEEIRTVIADPESADAWRMPRRNRFCGEIVRHGGWWPDHVLRLFRKSKARFSEDRVHESVIADGAVATLKNPIEHDTIVSLEDAREKAARYGAIAARQLAERGRQGSAAKAALRAAAAYLRAFVFRLGFLEGRLGHRVARYQAAYTYKKWSGAA